MKAARRQRYGSPDVIQVDEVPVPEPGADELLVRVHASTVSRTDCALLRGQFIMRPAIGFWGPRKKTLGTDFAGEVAAVGARVTEFRVGDKVWGINDMGAQSHAEYLVISRRDAVTSMPPALSFEAAAASIEGPWYAYSTLERARITGGQRVLINGATGAIGVAVLQLCVQRGARVTAVGNGKNLELLRSLGAERVIDYERTDFTSDAELQDCVVDAVGKSSFFACKHLLVPRGVYVSAEPGRGWQNPFLALVTPAFGGKRVVFPFPVARKAFFAAIAPLVERHLRPVIDRTVTLAEIREAYAYAASGQKTGSVVLKLAG